MKTDSTLLDFIVEFTSHWSDGVVDYEQTINIKAENKKRSKTFDGIAKAMAVQWSSYACR